MKPIFLHKLSALVLSAVALLGCSTIDDVLVYGKGPFDHGPIPRSETALEGLHESSWGNSGKWGAKAGESDENDESSAEDGEETPGVVTAPPQ